MEGTEFSHKASAMSSFRSKPEEQHLSQPHTKTNCKVPQHWVLLQKISFPMGRFLLMSWIMRGRKYPQILKCGSSGVSLQTQNFSVCLWNCDSGRTRLKILHISNDFRAYVPFKVSKHCTWKTDLFSHWWWLGHIQQCLDVELLAHSSAMPTFVSGRFKCPISVVCVTPSPGASISGVPVTTEGLKIRRPCCCW